MISRQPSLAGEVNFENDVEEMDDEDGEDDGAPKRNVHGRKPTAFVPKGKPMASAGSRAKPHLESSASSVIWVAAKELDSSYCIGETI